MRELQCPKCGFYIPGRNALAAKFMEEALERQRKFDELLKQPAMTTFQREAIVSALKHGGKIEAIKLCREVTGMGLAEAKDWVEKLETSPDAPPSPAPEAGALSPIADLLFAGRMIDAIKLYREQVKPGAGLKESKDAVEQLEAGLRAQHPEKFSAKAKSGCAAVLAVLAVLLVVLVWIRF